MFKLLLIFLPIFIYGNNIVSANFQDNQFVVEFEKSLSKKDVSKLKEWKKIWFLDVKNSFFKDGFKKYYQKDVQVRITRLNSKLSRISFNTSRVEYKVQKNKIILTFKDLNTIKKKNIMKKKNLHNLKHNKINKIISAKFEDYNQFVVKFEKPLFQDEVSNLKQWKKNWYFDIQNSFFKDGLKRFHKKNVQIRVTRIKSDLSRISFNTNRIEYKIKDNKLILKFRDLYKYVIVIDPGHGGIDGGSICRKYGTMEKRIVFSIAKYTKKELEKMGFKVLLTREKDKFIELIDRTRFANKHDADIFVSIHADATPKKGNFHNANGVTTYFFSEDKDKRAKNVTIRENKRIYKQDFKTTGYKTLNSFSKAKNHLRRVESQRLGIDIQNHVINNLQKKFKNIKSRGVHSAPLWVLVGAQMPAVLIEVGYVTGNIDAKHLKQRYYRKIIAKGIAQGIRNYLKIREKNGF